MTKYVREMASIFHGFRIDNLHSTPIFIAEYFIRKARKANINLHVFGELFSGSDALDAEYTKRLGASALVREVLNCHDHTSLCWTLQTFGRITANSVGKLDPYQIRDQ